MRKPTLPPNLPLTWRRERKLLCEYGGCRLEEIVSTKSMIITWQDGTQSRLLPSKNPRGILFWFPDMQAYFRRLINETYGKPWFSPGFAEYLDILDNYYENYYLIQEPSSGTN
jgi:hypothetical protein